MDYTVINICGAIIEYFAIYAFLWIFFESDDDKKHWRYACHIVMPILFFLFATFVANIYLRPLLFVVCTWFVAYGFRGDLAYRIFSVSLFQVILIFIEIAVSFFLQEHLQNSHYEYYLGMNIYVKLATLFIIMVLFLLSRKRRFIFAPLKWNYTAILLLFPALSFFLIAFCQYVLLELGRFELFKVISFAIVLCIGVNTALYYLFYQLAAGEEAKRRLQFTEFYLSRQKEQQNYMEHAHREIRKLSHDMDNYLAAIANLLQQGKTEEAIYELQRRRTEIKDNKLLDTGYPLLNSTISYKFQVAQEQHIQTQLFWNLLPSLNINLIDLAVILSNGLDNAIEAASQVTTAIPFLSVKVDSKDDFIRIQINNSTAAAPLIEDGKLLTTKSDNKLHGLGFESIQTLARRYDGDAFFDCKDNIFMLTVVLRNIALKSE